MFAPNCPRPHQNRYLLNAIGGQVVAGKAAASLPVVHGSDAGLRAVRSFFALAFHRAVLLVVFFRTVPLPVAHVLLVDAELDAGVVHARACAAKLGFVADYLALGFVLSFVAIGAAVAHPCVLQAQEHEIFLASSTK